MEITEMSFKMDLLLLFVPNDNSESEYSETRIPKTEIRKKNPNSEKKNLKSEPEVQN